MTHSGQFQYLLTGKVHQGFLRSAQTLGEIRFSMNRMIYEKSVILGSQRPRERVSECPAGVRWGGPRGPCCCRRRTGDGEEEEEEEKEEEIAVPTA